MAAGLEMTIPLFSELIVNRVVGHRNFRLLWTGEWPGLAACRELGWWAVRDADAGWRSCAPGTPGAVEDLNRLNFFQMAGYDGLYASDDYQLGGDADRPYASDS